MKHLSFSTRDGIEIISESEHAVNFFRQHDVVTKN